MNLATLFSSLKHFEEAIPRYKEVLAIRQKVFGAEHQLTVETAKELIAVRQLAKQSRRVLNPGHDFRMCSWCSLVWRICWFAFAFARGTATPTASCSTGRRTGRCAMFASSAALWWPRSSAALAARRQCIATQSAARLTGVRTRRSVSKLGKVNVVVLYDRAPATRLFATECTLSAPRLYLGPLTLRLYSGQDA
jgi:hypothetical protein